MQSALLKLVVEMAVNSLIGCRGVEERWGATLEAAIGKPRC